jgi:sugar phosphate isomerase/epimerase
MHPSQIALQLYTVRSLTAADMAGALEQVADAGYIAVEFAGYGSLTAPAVAAKLDELGMRAIGAHVAATRLDAEFDAVVAEMQVLGCPAITMPWLPPELRVTTLEGARAFAARLTRWAAQAHAAGLRFGYHNHDFEFVAVDGKRTVFDVLLDETQGVDFQLDASWALVANIDPVALLARMHGRAHSLHVKDMSVIATATDTPVGLGIVDWPPILAAADAAGVEWYIAEQDYPQNPAADIVTSWDNLTRMLRG